CFFLMLACHETDRADPVCNCPNMTGVVIVVPTDQSTNIESMEGSGTACSGSAEQNGDDYEIQVKGPGQCEVRIVFMDGAPDLVETIHVSECIGEPCCCGP